MCWKLSCGSLGSHTDDAIEKQHTRKENGLALFLQREFLVDHIICWKLDLAPQDLTAVLLPSNFSLSECYSRCRIPRRLFFFFNNIHVQIPAFGVLCCADGIPKSKCRMNGWTEGLGLSKSMIGFTVLFSHFSSSFYIPRGIYLVVIVFRGVERWQNVLIGMDGRERSYLHFSKSSGEKHQKEANLDIDLSVRRQFIAF